MKTIIQYSVLTFIFLITLLLVMNISFISAMKSEMNDSIGISERNVLKANNINKIYELSEEEMTIELIRNIGSNTNVDKNMDVYVHDVKEEGLIDVSLKSTFEHLNGKEDVRTVRKTMIVEEYEK
ncbi:MAG: hypothetical protein RSC93_07280 [Erysipelotrichaceae bacterium]